MTRALSILSAYLAHYGPRALVCEALKVAGVFVVIGVLFAFSAASGSRPSDPAPQANAVEARVGMDTRP